MTVARLQFPFVMRKPTLGAAEFDVCFFRSRGIFDVRPAQRP
jgi:hypothetical protein